jgi:DNA-binding MarR family transcriptional regulator
MAMAQTDTPAQSPAARPPRELVQTVPFLLKRLGMEMKDRSAAAFEGTGLTGQHYAVLLVLCEGARETQGTIADALGYDRSLLVGLLDDLEELGYVVRRRDPADRRRHVVTITDSGEDAVAKLRTLTRRLERDFLTPLDAGERATLQELLLKLMSHHDIRCAASLSR